MHAGGARRLGLHAAQVKILRGCRRQRPVGGLWAKPPEAGASLEFNWCFMHFDRQVFETENCRLENP